ncbi:MAG: penicillin-binding protein activator LpoB [Planctomycetes bacterium]|nr:penicillin-binding protein activator LpoB [Planctomycetota bacterium]
MKKTLTLALLLPITITACSSMRYGDPKSVETVNIDWGSTDLQTVSEAMVKSLLEAPQLAYLNTAGKGDDKRVVIYMGGVRNESSEHINLEAVTDSIRTEMIRSGRFRFVADMKGQNEISDQLRFQNEAGRVNPEQAKKTGKQLGADVVLYGTLSSIEKEKGRSIESGGVKTEDTYYQFVLNAVNIETGEIIWADKRDIRKTQKTGVFG